MKKFPYDNVMHVEMDFDQMFLLHPLPEMSAYRTPIKNLYLTGASTIPAACSPLRDTTRRKLFWKMWKENGSKSVSEKSPSVG